MKTFEIKTHDLLPLIEVELAPATLDLTGLPVFFNMKNLADDTVKISRGAMVVTNATNPPRAAYTWQIGDTDTAGRFSAEVEVMHSGSKPETYPSSKKKNIFVFIDDDIA